MTVDDVNRSDRKGSSWTRASSRRGWSLLWPVSHRREPRADQCERCRGRNGSRTGSTATPRTAGATRSTVSTSSVYLCSVTGSSVAWLASRTRGGRRAVRPPSGRSFRRERLTHEV